MLWLLSGSRPGHTLYRNRKNRVFCKARNIRLSGPKLGRKPKDKQARKTDRRVEQSDFKGRIPVEGKFGPGQTPLWAGQDLRDAQE
ncbi:transposase [Sporolactobacillus sp. THM19-2]|uniref:transposase n=1 Tax=Sporolactobacillus sp. THM19-2 TaxID=2511171 RepID=UPI0013EB7F32